MRKRGGKVHITLKSQLTISAYMPNTIKLRNSDQGTLSFLWKKECRE